MPNCFSLYSKETKLATPFNKIDDDIRVAFGAPPDPVKYYLGWYDLIGLPLAMGETFEQIRKRWEEYGDMATEIAILDWISERYTSDAWYERRVQ